MNVDALAGITPAAVEATSALPLLSVEALAVQYALGGERRRVVHDVSFNLAPREVLALVGESGSGKSTIAQAVPGLLPANGRIERGAIRLGGEDIARWPEARLAALRGARISLIPQDPVTSLNPVRTVGAQIAEIFALHGWRDRDTIRVRVLELLEQVGLAPAAFRAGQYPHELSGGMRQRVLIAIAVALGPGLIVADEPSSALNVTVQRRILDLIDDLRRQNGTSVLLVTHDLGVAADRADRIVRPHPGRAAQCLCAPVAERRALARRCPAPPAGTGRDRRACHPRRGADP